jgi:hypothetical protein
MSRTDFWNRFEISWTAATSGPAWSCACTSSTYCRRCRRTRSTWTSASRRADGTVRPTAGHIFWDERFIFPFLNFQRPAHPQRGQPRDRRVGPWPGDGLYEVVVLERPLDMPWSPSLAGGASTGRRQRSVDPRDRAHDCRRWDRCHCGALHRNGGHIGVCCFVLDGLGPYPYVHVGGLGVRGSAALKGRAE